MPGRNGGSYSFGFQGLLQDNEIKGKGNSYTTPFRSYDSRLGKWLSLDPLAAKFPWQSPYVAFDNNPIYFIDPNDAAGKPSKYQAAAGVAATRLIQGNLGFFESGTQRDFNSDFFQSTTSTYDNRPVLTVNYANGNTASKAILNIFDTPGDYDLECAELVQYSHLYAQLKVMGKKKFDNLYNENNPLTIESHKSKGVETKNLYSRDEGYWHKNGTPSPNIKSVAGIIQNGAIGTRISFSNRDAEKGSDWENENVIKVGENKYVAQGLGEYTSLKDISVALARISYDPVVHGNDFDAYRKRTVYISQVEEYVDQ